MFSMSVDSSHALAAHRRLKQSLMREIPADCEKAKEILVEKVQEDLEKKILRPRESSGTLSRYVTGSVFKRGGKLVIGVGNIAVMDAEAPWWRLQNDGGPIKVKAVPGFFVDQSGNRVAFETKRGTKATVRGTKWTGIVQSMDLFIYKKDSGSIMWIKKDVKPKRYFEGGDLAARDPVLTIFGNGMRRVFH